MVSATLPHVDESDRRRIVDSEHLKLLSWAYLASGCFTLLYALVPGLLVVFFGTMAFSSRFASEGRGEALPAVAFAGFIAVAFLVFAFVGGLRVYAGVSIRARRRRVFCLVVAALSCLEVPYGTLLGIATFYVLQRESVTAAFDRGVPPSRDVSPQVGGGGGQ